MESDQSSEQIRSGLIYFYFVIMTVIYLRGDYQHVISFFQTPSLALGVLTLNGSLL